MPDGQPDRSSWKHCSPPASQPHRQAALCGRFSQRLVLGLATIDLERSLFPQRLVRGRATMNLEQSDAPPEADQREGKSFAKCLNLPMSYDSQLGSQSLL